MKSMFSRGCKMETQTHRFTWQEIEIEVNYTPLKWDVIAHLEIRSINPEGAPLPISDTGYRSHYHQPGTIETHGGDVVEQVSAWLDEKAKSKNWQTFLENSRQYTLF